MPSFDNDEPTILYRYYEDHGELLYVGISNNFIRRDEQHLMDRWRGEVLWVHQELWETRRDASRAEERAIKTEKPKYNIRSWPYDEPRTEPEDLGWFIVLNACDETHLYLPPEACDPPYFTTPRNQRLGRENLPDIAGTNGKS